ncbi:unnamed protein product [Phytophthora fragariaefolia]|uniref:Unnamed protein product n=1 Tax=Phytophthora fragariaefolia TaxID=1490495 RepID=A0A9W7D9D6_9STRA|nr:unnamed protein product [Phytophthora fragariaefolia]
MDFVTHMPESERGNTFLLLFQDAFSGYVMCKPMRSTTAQDVAEVYEECVFRRFGASSMVRHDQDPRFMSEVFTRFRELLGSKQRATLAYRPQANGQQERSVQTVVRSIRAYIAEADQSDWDDHAERLMFALNTSFDATRLDTPFYLVHGWDAQGTLSAMLGPKPSRSTHWSTSAVSSLVPSSQSVLPWKLKVAEDDDFDAALLPEDSWEPDSERNEYEVEKILDLRWSKRTRTSRRTREYLVKWKGYDDSEWLPLSQLSCGALLYVFNQGARARARFQTMQAGDDHPRA